MKTQDIAWLGPQQPGAPATAFAQRQALPCGCSALVGFEIESKEKVLTFVACSQEHQPICELANTALIASFEHPEDREVIDVMGELLLMAAGGEAG